MTGVDWSRYVGWDGMQLEQGEGRSYSGFALDVMHGRCPLKH